MAMYDKFIKCTLVGIELTQGGVILPVVRVVLDTGGADRIELTADEHAALQEDVYNSIGGFVAVSSAWVNPNTVPDGFTLVTPELPVGTYSYGDRTTGFGVEFKTLAHSNNKVNHVRYTPSGTETVGFFYKNHSLCTAAVFTGYSTYEYAPLAIVTDSDYNLYYVGRNVFYTPPVRRSTYIDTFPRNGNVVALYEISSSTRGGTPRVAPRFLKTDNIYDYITNEIDPTELDPYGGAGDSEPGGGDGNFDFSSTVIPIPGLPNIGATDTGFISLYKPSATQLKALAYYMWAGAFDVAQFKKLFADPMDAILGLHIIPTIAGHPTEGSGNLLVGNVDTGLTMPTCLEQYYEADFGEVAIPAKWGAYLDYSPYTKLSLYLPYIGFVPLSADDCMRGSIKVVYHVDVLSGTCMAFVYCVSNRGADGHTLYMFNGSCSCDCPVTSGQYRSALEGLLGVAGSIGRVAAGDVAGGLKDAISNVTSMLKPEIGRSGSFGGSGGLMGIQYPYLVLTVPRMAIPGQQNTFIGYPSFVTKTIGDLTGYCSIDVSHLNNMPCTQAETDEIISLLGEGVIL